MRSSCRLPDFRGNTRTRRDLIRPVASVGEAVTITSGITQFSAQPWIGDAGHFGVLLTMVF